MTVAESENRNSPSNIRLFQLLMEVIMNIEILCERIELQPEIRNSVLSFIEEFDFQSVDKHQKGYLIYRNMNEALTKLRLCLVKIQME